MPYTLEVDKSACIGCGACAAICKNFKMVDDKSVPVKKEVAKLTCEQQAADACPVDCIKITQK